MLFEIDWVKFELFLIKFPVKGFNLIAIELGGGGVVICLPSLGREAEGHA